MFVCVCVRVVKTNSESKSRWSGEQRTEQRTAREDIKKRESKGGALRSKVKCVSHMIVTRKRWSDPVSPRSSFLSTVEQEQRFHRN